MIHVLVVNLNNLALTKDLIGDLLEQNYLFRLTVVDQASSEPRTQEDLTFLRGMPDIKVIMLAKKEGLNRVWNGFFQSTNEDYLCFLNNDVRIPRNFIEDTELILDKEPSVGCVVHATNHPEQKAPLDYVIPRKKFVQGWDFTIRREAYVPIPDDLATFGGDDWIFSNLYEKGWKVAVALSSPIIHFKGKSHKFFEGDRNQEVLNLRKYGYERLPYGSPYSRMRPCTQ